MREIRRLTATELQSGRVLFAVKPQVARHVPMREGARSHHLGVQQRTLAQQAVEEAAMPIGPRHHGCNRHFPLIFSQ